MRHPAETLEATIAEYEQTFRAAQSDAAVYKARPLTGIWATAPYLHNGSVPNLYELLLPAAERSSEFYVGNRLFDPERVGYVTAAETTTGDAAFRFDTTVTGNLNTGHEYAAELSDVERQELLEYLKSL